MITRTKRHKYLLNIFFATLAILAAGIGSLFILMDSDNEFMTKAHKLENTFLLENFTSAMAITGSILLFSSILFYGVSLLFALSISNDVFAIAEDHWFLIITLFPPVSIFYVFLRLFVGFSYSHDKLQQLNKAEELYEAAYEIETQEIKAFNKDFETAIKYANKNKVFVTRVKVRNKETGIKEEKWQVVNKHHSLKTIFEKRAQALKYAQKVENPKIIAITNVDARLEYWLTFLDKSNVPVVKTTKKNIKAFNDGQNILFTELGIKNIALSNPVVEQKSTQIARKKIIDIIKTKEIKLDNKNSKADGKNKKVVPLIKPNSVVMKEIKENQKVQKKIKKVIEIKNIIKADKPTTPSLKMVIPTDKVIEKTALILAKAAPKPKKTKKVAKKK